LSLPDIKRTSLETLVDRRHEPPARAKADITPTPDLRAPSFRKDSMEDEAAEAFKKTKAAMPK
jgi:hypothetical protein